MSKYLFQGKVRSGRIMWRPLAIFGCDCETGIMAAKVFPGDCERRPRGSQSDIIQHQVQTQNQAVVAEEASKMSETGVNY